MNDRAGVVVILVYLLVFGVGMASRGRTRIAIAAVLGVAGVALLGFAAVHTFGGAS